MSELQCDLPPGYLLAISRHRRWPLLYGAPHDWQEPQGPETWTAYHMGRVSAGLREVAHTFGTRLLPAFQKAAEAMRGLEDLLGPVSVLG